MKDIINFSDLSPEGKQEFTDHIFKEIFRHKDDISQGQSELKWIYKHYGIKPRTIYVGKWVEVTNQCERKQTLFEKYKKIHTVTDVIK